MAHFRDNVRVQYCHDSVEILSSLENGLQQMKKGSARFHAFVVDNLKNFHALEANLYFMLLNQGHGVPMMMMHGTFFHFLCTVKINAVRN